jgi:hypothetical protein
MTQDEIIEMARQAGITVEAGGRSYEQLLRIINAFAKLVAQHEREACAEICKKHADVYALLEQNPHAFGTAKPAWAACIDNRDTILARGKA